MNLILWGFCLKAKGIKFISFAWFWNLSPADVLLYLITLGFWQVPFLCPTLRNFTHILGMVLVSQIFLSPCSHFVFSPHCAHVHTHKHILIHIFTHTYTNALNTQRQTSLEIYACTHKCTNIHIPPQIHIYTLPRPICICLLFLSQFYLSHIIPFYLYFFFYKEPSNCIQQKLPLC